MNLEQINEKAITLARRLGGYTDRSGKHSPGIID